MYQIRRFAIAALLLAPLFAQAENNLHPGIFKSAALYLDQGDGLITNIPSHEHTEMIRQVSSFRTKLEASRQQATEQVEDSRFTAKDTLLTIILPGGLLYAASRRQQLSKAQERLSRVSDQLQEVETDLKLLKSLSFRDSIAYLGQP